MYHYRSKVYKKHTTNGYYPSLKSFKQQGSTFHKTGDFSEALNSYREALLFLPSGQLYGKKQALRIEILSRSMKSHLKIRNPTFDNEREQLEKDIFWLDQRPNQFVSSALRALSLLQITRSYCLELNYERAWLFLREFLRYADHELKEQAMQTRIQILQKLLDYWLFHKVVNIGPAEALISIDKANSCSICFDKYTDGECECLLLDCGHKFHPLCVLKWLSEEKMQCPFCRASVPGWEAISR